VFWAWAQQQAALEEPLRLTRRRAIQMQLQADADLAKAVHREAFLAMPVSHGDKSSSAGAQRVQGSPCSADG